MLLAGFIDAPLTGLECNKETNINNFSKKSKFCKKFSILVEILALYIWLEVGKLNYPATKTFKVIVIPTAIPANSPICKGAGVGGVELFQLNLKDIYNQLRLIKSY